MRVDHEFESMWANFPEGTILNDANHWHLSPPNDCELRRAAGYARRPRYVINVVAQPPAITSRRSRVGSSDWLGGILKGNNLPVSYHEIGIG